MDASLDADELDGVCRGALSSVLSDAQWDSDKANTLTTQIIEHVLKALATLARPYKFAVTVVLQQRNGAGTHFASSSRWDSRRDSSVAVPFESQTIQAMVTVFAVSLSPSPQQGA